MEDSDVDFPWSPEEIVVNQACEDDGPLAWPTPSPADLCRLVSNELLELVRVIDHLASVDFPPAKDVALLLIYGAAGDLIPATCVELFAAGSTNLLPKIGWRGLPRVVKGPPAASFHAAAARLVQDTGRSLAADRESNWLHHATFAVESQRYYSGKEMRVVRDGLARELETLGQLAAERPKGIRGEMVAALLQMELAQALTASSAIPLSAMEARDGRADFPLTMVAEFLRREFAERAKHDTAPTEGLTADRWLEEQLKKPVGELLAMAMPAADWRGIVRPTFDDVVKLPAEQVFDRDELIESSTGPRIIKLRTRKHRAEGPCILQKLLKKGERDQVKLEVQSGCKPKYVHKIKSQFFEHEGFALLNAEHTLTAKAIAEKLDCGEDQAERIRQRWLLRTQPGYQ